MLRLGQGVTVAGRVVKNGKGLARTSVGLVSVDRTPEGFTGDYEIGTTEDGRFAFPTIPPEREYFIYSMMKDAQRNGGVVPAQNIRLGKDGETTRAGDLIVERSFRIAGRLILADGTPLPPGARMMLGREQAWDQLPSVDVSSDGRFVFDGVPKESISVTPRLKGCRLSLPNPSLDRLNGFSIIGRIEGDVSDLVILLEPGEFLRDYQSDLGADPQPYNKPLRSFQAPVTRDAQ